MLFELWCWRRLLRVPWTTRRSNQSILKEMSPEYSLEGLMLKLKLQYFGHLIRRNYSLEKTLMLGKIEGRGTEDWRGWQRMRWLNGIIDLMDMSLSKLQESVMGREAWHVTVHGAAKSQTRLSNWTELKAGNKVDFWPPDSKNWLIGKYTDSGKDWRQEEKGMSENEMVGWHHWLDGHEFEQAVGVGDGQGSLACCSPWGSKESDTTEWLNWTEVIH